MVEWQFFVVYGKEILVKEFFQCCEQILELADYWIVVVYGIGCLCGVVCIYQDGDCNVNIDSENEKLGEDVYYIYCLLWKIYYIYSFN